MTTQNTSYFWPIRLAARTTDFHSVNKVSITLWVTNLFLVAKFCKGEEVKKPGFKRTRSAAGHQHCGVCHPSLKNGRSRERQQTRQECRELLLHSNSHKYAYSDLTIDEEIELMNLIKSLPTNTQDA